MQANDLNPEFLLTLAGVGVSGGLFWLASHRAGQPADPLRPRLVPWRGLIIAAGFAAFVALVHLVNLVGITTGR